MDVFSKLSFEKLTESVLGKRGSSGKAFCYGSIFCGYHTSPLVWGFYAYARTKNPRKFPYQWMNPKNVTSIYKSTSQGIMLRNWGYTLFINVFSTFLFRKGSRWKKRGLVLFPASLLLTLLWKSIQISVPACLHDVHSNYVHRHYPCPFHLS